MRIRFCLFLSLALIAVFAATSFGQAGMGNECTPAGLWYGGSATPYKLTITQTGPATHYQAVFEPMYKNVVLNTTYTSLLEKKGNKYEGAGVILVSQDPNFVLQYPPPETPDLVVGWFSMELLDCNTIKNTIPFLGYYFGPPIWELAVGGVNWVSPSKVPLVDPPDLDLLVMTNGGAPEIERYRRIATKVNPALLH